MRSHLEWPEHAIKLPSIQSHMGLWSNEIRENSLTAIQEAKLNNIPMVEIDVRLSSDNQVVIFHDETLMRFFESRDKISDLSSQRLKAEFDIPLLSEALAIDINLNIEIKTNQLLGGRLELMVAEEILKARAQSRVIISSFNPLTLNLMAQFLPDVPRAWLISSSQPWWVRNLLLDSWVSYHALDLDHRMLNEE